MYSLLAPRPGFGMPVKIFYQNVGTDTIVNGDIELIKDPRLNVNASSPAYSSISGDTLRWSYNSLKPLDTASIAVSFDVSSSLNTGDTILSTAVIDPVHNDLVPADNSFALRQKLVGSYDPNNKSENHAGTVTTTQVVNGDYLYYTIRFQNTGTYAAFNIVVKDTLSNKLDWNTFEMVDASNSYQLNISGGNKCTWYFNAIALPDSNADEPASHGYIVYRIKAKNSLTAGSIINNAAGIYFDYNQSVETNTEKTTVVTSVLPLQLIAFSAEHNGKANLLQWSTANEVNTNYFDVQRSSDGRNFSNIGVVNASGSSKLVNNYTYTDEQPLKAVNYYRLKMTDKDGRFTYSAVRSLDNAGSIDLALYPNPVKDVLVLVFNAEKNLHVKIEISAADGKRVFAKQTQVVPGQSKQIINTSSLNAGQYFIKCITDDGEISLKFIKQ